MRSATTRPVSEEGSVISKDHSISRTTRSMKMESGGGVEVERVEDDEEDEVRGVWGDVGVGVGIMLRSSLCNGEPCGRLLRFTQKRTTG